uniref:Tetratricopeptide repeat protein n=1 Tax=Setaria digitata TaxID=48799 RepID=A0A915PNM4_9BILA
MLHLRFFPMVCENSDMDDASKMKTVQEEKYEEPAEEMYWKAMVLKNSNSEESLREAKSLAEKAVKINPTSWESVLLFGEISLKMKTDDPCATSAFLKAAKLNPYSSKAFFYLGLSLKTKNRLKAIACLERAAKIRPKYDEVAKLLDQLMTLEGRNEDLLKYLLQYSKTVPSAVWARKRLASLELQIGNIDAAIDHMQHIVILDKADADIWVALGDVYKKRGNYQCAIKAYKEAIEIEPTDEIAQIQASPYFITYEAIQQCLKLEKLVETGKSSTDCIYLLHAKSVLKLAQKSPYSLQFDLLNQFFDLVEKIFDQKQEFILSFKLAGDALLLASRYHIDTFQRFKFPRIWKIGLVLDAVELAIRFYCSVVKAHRNWDGAWNDLGIALFRKCQVTGNNSECANTVECFKRAIKLSSSKTMKSAYWTNLSEAVALSGNALMIQHCLVRALQLNTRNDTAWFLLGLLYMKFSKCDLARQALNMAQRINPESAEIWCAMVNIEAAMAEAENHYDAMDLYRHSLTFKPTELAVKKYTYYLMKNLAEGKQTDNATMFDFESVHEIIGISKRTDEFIFFVSLLAEHFWYMDYAVHYINYCHDWPNEDVCRVHKQRIALRSGDHHLLEKVGTIQNLSLLYSSTTSEIYDKLLRECPVYAHLFSAVERGDVKCFREISMNSENKIQLPLFIAAALYFQKNLTDEFVSVLRDIRPRHEIALVYPTCSKQDDETAECVSEIPEELGEKIIVRYDNMSKRLCDLLALQVELKRLPKAAGAPP